eukprot:762705-Hanusia_phi.AAC.2
MGPMVAAPSVAFEAHDPVVVNGLDCKNAFNSLDRRALIDTLVGKAATNYLGALGDGYVLRPGDSISHCTSFAADILPYDSLVYQGDCLILKQQRRAESFPCSMGVHQGDPAGFIWPRFPPLRSFSFEAEGIALGGIPVGSTPFIQAWLSAKLTSLDHDLRLLGDLSKIHPFAQPRFPGCGILIRFTPGRLAASSGRGCSRSAPQPHAPGV